MECVVLGGTNLFLKKRCRRPPWHTQGRIGGWVNPAHYFPPHYLFASEPIYCTYFGTSVDILCSIRQICPCMQYWKSTGTYNMAFHKWCDVVNFRDTNFNKFSSISFLRLSSHIIEWMKAMFTKTKINSRASHPISFRNDYLSYRGDKIRHELCL